MIFLYIFFTMCIDSLMFRIYGSLFQKSSVLKSNFRYWIA